MAGNANSGRRPNERVIAQNLSIMLDEIDPTSGRKRMVRTLEALLQKAEEGDVAAINVVFDRLEGKPKQETSNSHTHEGKLEIVRRIVKD